MVAQPNEKIIAFQSANAAGDAGNPGQERHWYSRGRWEVTREKTDDKRPAVSVSDTAGIPLGFDDGGSQEDQQFLLGNAFRLVFEQPSKDRNP